MIARNHPGIEVKPLSLTDLTEESWRHELKNLITSPADLLRYTNLPQDLLTQLPETGMNFPLRVSRPYANRIRKGDPQDPLFLQVWPQSSEDVTSPGYLHDPLQEQGFTQTQGILQKYQNRALLVTTAACAIHCRYCFRRHFPYAEHRNSTSQWEGALASIAQSPDVNEVILSGGDPLMLTDQQLAGLIGKLGELPQVDTIRFHTRLPIMIPQRVTDQLISILAACGKRVVVVIHSNHANEFDIGVDRALAKLKPVTHALLNQTVLLEGINHQPQQLIALSERLFTAGVLPYYLHTLDKVQGAAHFEYQCHSYQPLMDALRAQLPGYLVPKLVTEEPGAKSKTPVFA